MTNSETGNWIIKADNGLSVDKNEQANKTARAQSQHAEQVALHAANDAAAAMEEAEHARIIADSANKTAWKANNFGIVAICMSVGTIVYNIINVVIR